MDALLRSIRDFQYEVQENDRTPSERFFILRGGTLGNLEASGYMNDVLFRAAIHLGPYRDVQGNGCRLLLSLMERNFGNNIARVGIAIIAENNERVPHILAETAFLWEGIQQRHFDAYMEDLVQVVYEASRILHENGGTDDSNPFFEVLQAEQNRSVAR